MSSSQKFTLGIGQELSSGLDFYARSVVIQNPTPAYWYLPEAQTFVPPHVANHIVRLNAATSADIKCQSPAGIAQLLTAPTSSGQFATFTFTDEILAPINGYQGYAAAGGETRRYEAPFTIVGLVASLFQLSTPAPEGVLAEIISGFTAGLHTFSMSYQIPGAPIFTDARWAFISSGGNIANIPQFLISRYLPAGTLLSFGQDDPGNTILFQISY